MKAVGTVPGRRGSLRLLEIDPPLCSAEEVLVGVRLVGLDATTPSWPRGSTGPRPRAQGTSSSATSRWAR